jgi:hypothetical protein
VPGHEDIAGNETADQLARMGSEHPFIGSEPASSITVGIAKKAIRDWTNRNHQKYWESLTGHTRILCQKNEGAVKIKQKPAMMGGRNIYRTLSPKRTPFLIRIDSPVCERRQEKDELAAYILCDCEAIAYLRFSHLGQLFWNQVTTITPLYMKSYVSFEV